MSDPGTNLEPTLAVLTRQVQVRVVNCSASGCLLECSSPIEVGTVASLRLLVDNEELADGLRVVRCQPIEGGSSYHVGAEFLWITPPGQQSLRLGLGRQGAPQSRTAAGN